MTNSNFNLYDVLKQDSGYQAKVKQREAEMEYVTRMNERADKRAMEQAQLGEKVSKEMDILSAMIEGLENPDVERVKGVEKEARKIIMEGVKSANGDMKSFLLNGGMSKIREYKNSVMTSESLQTAQKNAIRLKAIQKDYRDGKIHDRVEVNGEMRTSKDLINMFYNEEIQEIPALTAYKKPTFDVMYFTKHYNPKDPYNSSLVDVETAVNAISSNEGVSRDVAMQSIEDMVVDGKLSGVYWGIKDGENWKSDAIRNSNASRNTGGKKGVKATQAQLNKMLKGIKANGGIVESRWATDDGNELVHKTTYSLPANQNKILFSELFDVGLDADGEFRDGIKSQVGVTNLFNGKTFKIEGHAYTPISLGNGLSVLQSMKKGEDGNAIRDANGNPIPDKDQLYGEAQIFMTEDAFKNLKKKQGITERHFDNIANDATVGGEDGVIINVGLFIDKDNPNIAMELAEAVKASDVEQFQDDSANLKRTPWGTNEDVTTNEYERRNNTYNAIRNDLVRKQPNLSLQIISEQARERLFQIEKLVKSQNQ